LYIEVIDVAHIQILNQVFTNDHLIINPKFFEFIFNINLTLIEILNLIIISFHSIIITIFKIFPILYLISLFNSIVFYTNLIKFKFAYAILHLHY
jgi:hypothetical protein